MADEKTQSGNAATAESINPEKLVRVTFLPEGKTVEFEHGNLPYEEHGKRDSIQIGRAHV